jgi:hypothetical protein
MRGDDAKRLRRALTTMYNAIDRFANSGLDRQQSMPDGVRENTTKDIEKMVMTYWKATELLQNRIFGTAKVSEADIIRAFDAIG